MNRTHVVNESELDWTAGKNGENFELERKQLGAAAGGRHLGCSLIRVPPGKCAWPFHYHCANEESIYILEGEGVLRLGDKEIPVKTGDYLAFPPGPETAHQLRNASKRVLLYLCLSTMIPTEVVGYPDSKKLGMIAGSAPGGDSKKRHITSFFRADDAVPYWYGEE